jgi:hypothetical protein
VVWSRRFGGVDDSILFVEELRRWRQQFAWCSVAQHPPENWTVRLLLLGLLELGFSIVVRHLGGQMMV